MFVRSCADVGQLQLWFGNKKKCFGRHDLSSMIDDVHSVPHVGFKESSGALNAWPMMIISYWSSARHVEKVCV